MTKRLQILLYVITGYLAVFGAIFLFAPAVAERMTKAPHDPAFRLLDGLYSLVFALVAFLAAREKQGASKLSLVILVVTAGHVVVFGYLLLSGTQAFAQAGPPLIVNALLAVLLLWFRRNRTRVE